MSDVAEIRSGGVFLGKDAVELNLGDELGTWQDAKNMTKELGNAYEPEFVEMQKTGLSLFDLISGFL